ncbi:DUF3572 domain-containing protein [Aureimonas sp. N4]|uniref:DUF3572 domain-containing protein n=1 Tax=Aureimonas sp. N4 TaxID=1638165 RepID=UPI000781B7BF|nr:DUF3572 domain-containing protein [Aureimonas sp. N4]
MIRERTPDTDPDAIGIEALKFIASHQDLIDRFVEVTGVDVSQLRQAAAQPGFFVGVLDFILANEADVLDLASQLAMRPEGIGKARNLLAKRDGIQPEDYLS